jgi:hypothetical protein
MSDKVLQAGTRGYSQDAYRVGDLKRRLDTVGLAKLTNDGLGNLAAAGVYTFRRVVKNINRGLSLHVSVGLVGTGVGAPIESVILPAGAITMQLTPVNVFGDSPPMFLRPVFQDPTFSDNGNHPLPQDCPFGWEFESVGDDVYVDVTVTTALLLSLGITAKLQLQVAAEYSGAWPFPEALKYMLNQVQIAGGTSDMIFDTRSPG